MYQTMRQKKVINDFLKLFFKLKPKKVKNYLNRTNNFNKHINQQIEQKYILQKIKSYKKKIILDYGCNDCFFSTKLNNKFKYFGIDNNKELLKKNTKIFSKNFFFLKKNRLPFSKNYFDCIILSHVIAHIYDTNRLFEEISRVLKKDGIIIIVSPNKIYKFFYFFLNLFNNYFPDETISKHYSQNEIFKITKNNLKILESHSYSIINKKISSQFINSRIIVILKKKFF